MGDSGPHVCIKGFSNRRLDLLLSCTYVVKYLCIYNFIKCNMNFDILIVVSPYVLPWKFCEGNGYVSFCFTTEKLPQHCVGHLWDNRRFTLFRDNYSDEPVVLSQIEGLSLWSPTIRAVLKLAEHSAWPAHP